MDKLVDTLLGKISRYEVATNLIPGTLLTLILRRIGFDFFIDSTFINLIICYYIGLINNRFSSLCVEGLMRRLNLIEWRDYNKYNKAKKERPFIATLQEIANQYRSFTAVFILSVLALGYYYIQSSCHFVAEYGYVFVIILVTLLFFFSYRKQVNDYVVKNIDEVVSCDNNIS